MEYLGFSINLNTHTDNRSSNTGSCNKHINCHLNRTKKGSAAQLALKGEYHNNSAFS